MSTDRWPAWVYAEGDEPDFRFSLANERTFLAWLRTTLALIAAGVAVNVIDFGISEGVVHGLSALLLGLGVITPATAFVRWARAERAMRHETPLPSMGALAVVLTCVVLLVAAILAVVVVVL
ncbi:DUF202 domain-containing protein [Janibacter cremeus]|uniref:Putative membrane protein n=1 Tax=Janibacter cremeus TaxID=1285192 RepID=A0A852VR31_9MICO|nr:putative membrane protein [Janibacter cremeus]